MTTPDQKYTYRNQAQEIFDYIKEYPGATVESIVSGTGWNRHLVEVAVKLMVEQGLVKEVGQTNWLDFRYEAIDQDAPKPTRVEQITAEVSGLVDKINQDLQISTPSKVFGPSPLQKVASVASGIAAGFVNPFPPFSQSIADSREYERSLIEIAAMADVTPTEIAEFHQSTPYSLEFIKAAIQAGAKLDEEDIKRTMEEKSSYGYKFVSYDSPDQLNEIINKGAFGKQNRIYTVTFPNGDRREVTAAYMEVDGGTLYFEDEDHDTILAYGPGHWVWAERKEDTQTPT